MASIRAYTTGSGERRYEVRWRDPDGKHRSKTELRAEDAKRRKLDVERRLSLGLLYEEEGLAFGPYYDGWLERKAPGWRPGTLRNARAARRHLEPLAGLLLSQVRRADFEDLTAAMARTAPRQAQMALQYGKQVIRDAQARGHRVDAAVLTIPKPRYEERLPRFLSAAEAERLAYECSEPHLITFAYLSGARQGECFALEESALNLDAGYIVIRRGAWEGKLQPTKSGRERRVYLPRAAVQALREQLLARPHRHNGLVFPNPSGGVWRKGQLSRVFIPARERAGLEDVHFHDLRHTYASLMIAAGVNPLQLAAALGHVDRNGKPDPTLIWKRYGHLYPGSGEAAAAALEEYLRAPALEEAR